MEKALLMQNRHWLNMLYPDLMPRTVFAELVKKLAMREIEIITGIRRAGKSTIFELLINHLMQDNDPKSILYINLDDPLYFELWDDPQQFYQVLDLAEKITGIKTDYLFLDEVQNVTAWERFVKSSYDSRLFKKIFITGSNSQLLTSDYAGLLTGRYTTNHIGPLSFSEMLQQAKITTQLDLSQNKATVLKIMEQMLFYGSFPEVVKHEDVELKRDILQNYFTSILFKDCILNHRVRETKLMRDLAIYLLTNYTSPYSFNGLARIFSSNDNTIKEFITILGDSFMVDEISHFSYSLKQQVRAKRKIYCVDNGLVFANASHFTENRGCYFENLVYTELKKCGVNNIYFFNDTRECDFIIKQGNNITAIQACYELNDRNRDREIKGLIYAMEKFNAQQGYVVTFNQESSLDNNAEITPFWKLFFNFKSNVA